MPQVVASTTDSDGYPVDLTEERWQHILNGHPELAPYQRHILDAVHAPTRRRPGRDVGEHWFFLATTRPSRWLHVVVRYKEHTGRIITAFARRSLP